MSKMLLTEQRIGSLSFVNEAVENQGSKNILGRLRGICAECDVPTRNGRKYTRKLWENVVSGDTFKEYLDNKVLYGELNHPEDRLETDIQKVAIALSDISLQDDGKVIGTFDILPTPCGKILKSLCDYGSKLGVSSRGGGDIVTRDGEEVVDENTYDFVTFDVVTLPAVKAARPSVIESVEYKDKIVPMKESILKTIEETSTKGELNSIKSILEKLELPEKDSLVESINKKLDTLEGETISSTVLDDLTEAIKRADKAEKANLELLEKLSAGTTRENKLKEELSKTKQSVKVIAEKSQKLLAVSNSQKTKDVESQSIIESLKKELETKENEHNLAIENLEHKLIEAKRASHMNSSRLTESMSKLNDSKKLTESYEKKIGEYKALLESSKKDYVIATKSYTKKLEESVSKLNDSEAKTRAITEKYVEMFCKYNGLSKSSIMERVGADGSFSTIDKVLAEALDYKLRIKTLPFEVSSKNVKMELVGEGVRLEKQPTRAANRDDDNLDSVARMLKNI